MATYTNWMQPQQNGPPGGGGMDGGNLQMGRGAQPGAYFGTGMTDSPTSMAMGMMNAPMQQPRPAFNASPGMDARAMTSPVQQPLSMPVASGGQFSPRAPMPNGPMGGDTRYSPIAPAVMPPAQMPPQQFSPMAPAGQPPMGGNRAYSPMAPAFRPPQQYSPMAPAQRPPLQFNGRPGGMFGMGDR